ncbi:hypothetical protein BT93_B3185 [Corymbia citriodora subsp. variegata]|nr:hypothetical protein BT93_B3185 [Corymbia citriodora subsp. variegata]
MQSSLWYTPIEIEYVMSQCKTLKKLKIRSSQVAGLTDRESSTQRRAKIIEGSVLFSAHKSNCLTAASFSTTMIVIYH